MQLTFQYLHSYSIVGTSQGQCLANKTCLCDVTKAGNQNGDTTGGQSKALKADRDKHAFQTEFAERINTIIFTKKKDRNNDDDGEDKKRFNDSDLMNINGINGKDNNNNNNNNNNISLTDLFKHRNRIEKKQLGSAEVPADVLNFTVVGLLYFQDYEFHVSLP